MIINDSLCPPPGYVEPYLVVYAENVVFVYDVNIAEWIQTMPLKNAKAISMDGEICLVQSTETPALVYLRERTLG